MRSTSAAPSMTALVLVTGIGPIATDTYLAALPELRHELGTTAAIAQLTLTAFIIGMAAGQLLLGPVSDAYGRRRLLIGGATVFTLASLACLLAQTGPQLVAVRLVQGAVAGGGVSIGRAVISDRYEGVAAAQRFGTLVSIVFLGPVLAPALGGLILSFGSWRAIFGLLTGLGVLMTLAAVLGLPETLPPERRHPPGIGHLLARMGGLTRHWGFMQHVAVQCLATGGFFTYIGGSSFVLQNAYGISPGLYSAVFATNALAMVLFSTVFRATVARAGARRLRTIGVTLSFSASTGVLIVALSDRDGTGPVVVVWALLCLVVGGMGLTIPSTTALAQDAGRSSSGTASALQGGIVFLVGALVTPLTGVLGYRTLLPMALLMCGFFAGAMLLLAVLRRQPALGGTALPR